MKSILLLSVFMFLLLSCQKEKDEEFSAEYLQFKPGLEIQKLKVEQRVADSMVIIIDEYLEGIKPMSCLYCVADSIHLYKVSDFCERNPESLIYVLESALKGSRLTFGFRKLFKEFYPEILSELLESEGIELIPNTEAITEEDLWENMSREYSLPLKLLAEEYLKVVRN
jgi:hypothetical protein